MIVSLYFIWDCIVNDKRLAFIVFQTDLTKKWIHVGNWKKKNLIKFLNGKRDSEPEVRLKVKRTAIVKIDCQDVPFSSVFSNDNSLV